MKKRIILVDDEKDFCYFMQKTLEASGDFDVQTSSEGLEAIKMIKANLPDLVLLDVMMPGISGPDVAAELREYNVTKNIPIVFVTAVVQDKDIADKENFIGGWHYLPKPVRTEELISLINRLA
ncbi:MAG: response regulator [Candidatus Omnitrophica bacterium]|nr:response regulator [Candidatus Omnitrophota bacterium]